MIERYETKAMKAIWDRQAKYEYWKQVEVAITEVHEEMGSVPAGTSDQIKQQASFTLERCDEIEKETRHDLMAFVRNLSETSGEAGKYIHMGVTSYDVIDTALGMMLRDSLVALSKDLNDLIRVIGDLAKKHADTPMIGRTHGIHAEPITFGHKIAGWYGELERAQKRLEDAREEIAVGKVSGAVGIHAITSPAMEQAVCKKLGLGVDPATTQIINRDRHARVLNELALLGAGLERVATELRNLQRTEIREVEEAFASGQTGSSAMPHKRNPWNSETVVGLARLLRANAHAMLESVATWHERDLTNSSLERIVFPDSCHLAHFMVLRLKTILEGINVFPQTMLANLRKMGDLVFSEHVMISLVSKGLPREQAYKVAQRNAAKAWEGEDFQTCVRQDETVMAHLSEKELDEIFSLEHHLRHKDAALVGSGILG